MEKLKLYFKQPYEEKGVIRATLDLLLRAITAVVWVWLVCILANLFLDALIHSYNPALKLWWFSYCFIIFFGASWIAYIILFVRDYYSAEE
ncbi:MAG: hypothetical protein IJ876_08135 [Elusimicrobiaceae bacterium]|nr:hypothetical protein [Elusimicrobiaceae bacterium]